MKYQNLALGIDLGTTSISAAVIDLDTRSQLEFFTVNHSADINSENSAFHEQCTETICDKAIGLAEKITDKYSGIRAIGLTGQMHGIVYIDADGNSVSNLINWQDKRGDCMTENGRTYCDEIQRITGFNIATGYGLASHYYNARNNLIPENASSFCSIMDYVGMKLTGRTSPVIHSSVAASFGLFDIKNCSFRADCLRLLEADDITLPEVTDEFTCIGEFRGARVSVAIGDNQASILGSVKDVENSVLINIGTGSQISMVTDIIDSTPAIEIRPLTKGRFIACASALCGGAAYALLEKFFREYAHAAGLPDTSQYDTLNALLKSAYSGKAPVLNVDTAFRGKRHDPLAKGSITGITRDNFTPGSMALGFVNGMCRELYEAFEGRITGKTAVVASGNAIQKIPVFREIISDMFALPVYISANREEASLGAALFACAGCGLLNTGDFGSFINYREL